MLDPAFHKRVSPVAPEPEPCRDCLPDDLCYFAIGVDIGSTAADACVVVGWRDDDDRVFLVNVMPIEKDSKK